MLYIFRAVPLPTIRSSKLYIQHRVFVELFLLLTAIVSELELVCVCCAELLMMDRGTGCNM